jgi:hypothetical protein
VQLVIEQRYNCIPWIPGARDVLCRFRIRAFIKAQMQFKKPGILTFGIVFQPFFSTEPIHWILQPGHVIIDAVKVGISAFSKLIEEILNQGRTTFGKGRQKNIGCAYRGLELL